MDILIYTSIILGSTGLLWLVLKLRQTGLLNAVEHVGVSLVSWARAQRWAKQECAAHYRALRPESFTSPNGWTNQPEGGR
jgi:hypothetical protein